MDQPIEKSPLKEKLIHVLDVLVHPLSQLIVICFIITLIGFISQKALDKQIPLEKYPQLIGVTPQHIEDWGGEPTIVEVGLQINNFPVFKVIENNFVLEGKLWFFFDPDLVSIETIKKFSFENGTYTEQSSPESRLIENKLLVEYNVRLSFNTELTYQAFPFDGHRLFISLVNMHVAPNELLLKTDDKQFLINPQVFIPEWKPIKQNTYSGYIETSLDTDDTKKVIRYPKIIFSIDFQHSGLRHIFIILLPLFLICAIGMMAVGAGSIIGGKSLDITMSCAAAIIAYRFVIETMSPQVSYLMIADYIFTFFLICSCAQLIYSKVTYHQIITFPLIIIRTIIFIIFYGGIIILWNFLIFTWIPNQKASAENLPSILSTTHQEKDIVPLSMQKIKPGKQIISVASILDLSRMNRAFGRQIKNGILLRLRKAIDDQELPNHQLSINFYDDQSSPLKSRQHFLSLLKNNTSFLFSCYGGRSLKSYLPLANQNNVGIIFPISGVERLRKKEVSHIINFRASQFQQGTILTKYAVDEIDAHKIGIFYENAGVGLDALAGAQSVMKEKVVPTDHITLVSYEGHDITYDTQIKQLKKGDPDTLFFFAAGGSTVQLIQQYGLENFVGKNLLGTSQLNQIFFQKVMESKGLTFITTSVTPNPTTSITQIALEFKKEAEKYDIPLGTYAFEGYINTEILIYLIKQIKGPVTSNALIKAAEKIVNYNLKGINLSFDPDSRSLSTSLWLNTGSPDWMEVPIHKK